jgi:hypothetical protein
MSMESHPFVHGGGLVTLVGETFPRAACVSCGRPAIYHTGVAGVEQAREVQRATTAPPWHPR